MSYSHEGFTDVDETGSASAFVAYLDEADTLPLIRRWRAEVAERLQLDAGDALLDVGCGTGTALIDLAPRVARATGVDLSEEMLAVARSRAPENVEFLAADATQLPFEDASFAAYRAERVYQHLPDPAAAFAEARRVLEPGGRIVVADPDWDGLVVDVDDRVTLRAALDATIATRPGATIGRRLSRLLTEAGFEHVEVEGSMPAVTDFGTASRMLLDALVFAEPAVEAVGAEALARLRDELAARTSFFAAMPIFVASANRR